MPTTHPTNPRNIFGFGTWVAWGSGRVPVGVNTSDGNFNSVEKTGGSNTHSHSLSSKTTGSHSLRETELPIHTHSIPSLSGVTNVNGSHRHNTGFCYWNLSRNSFDEKALAAIFMDDDRIYFDTNDAGNHTHNVTTNASTTGRSGGDNGHTHTLPDTPSTSSLQPYITCYMWKRTA